MFQSQFAELLKVGSIVVYKKKAGLETARLFSFDYCCFIFYLYLAQPTTLRFK